MSVNQLSAYMNMQKDALTGRELEASVLSRAGVMLKQVQDKWDDPDRIAKLTNAVAFNQKVWSYFQTELSNPNNPLPQQLREDILNLSIFVVKRLYEALSGPDPEMLSIVIDIDFSLATGLRTKAEDVTPPA
jgi:flagellar protein FlaF